MIFIFTFFLSLNKVFAEAIFASGFSAVTEGRTVPILYGGYDSSSFALTLSSVGVSNDVYYHSAYQLGAFRQTDLENFLWRPIRAGLGGGMHYAKRGLDQNGKTEEVSDFSLGPSVRVTWEVLPKTIIGIESYVGIGSFDFIILSTQHISTLFLGLRF